MKVLLDTCVWGGAKTELQATGHDMIWTGDLTQDPGDEEILAQAHREQRVLVTLDKDNDSILGNVPEVIDAGADFPTAGSPDTLAECLTSVMSIPENCESRHLAGKVPTPPSCNGKSPCSAGRRSGCRRRGCTKGRMAFSCCIMVLHGRPASPSLHLAP